MTILEESAKRRAALAMQEEILRKVTRGPADCSGSVTGALERDQTAAGGRAGRAEAPPGRAKKSRVLPRRPAPLKPRRRRRRNRTGGRTSSC